MAQISMFSRFVFGASVGFGSSIIVCGVFKSFYDYLTQCPPYDVEADLTGKTYVVTGATGGIGRAIAQKLAEKNARVIMTHRNYEKCTEIRRDIVLYSRNKQVFCRRCDLSDFDSIHEFVSQLYKDAAVDKVDGLVNCAAVVNSKRKLNKNGMENTLATNYLGTFLLTGLLMEKFLKQQGPSKVVFLNTKIAAEQNEGLDLKKLFDPDARYKYKWFEVYYCSKLALLMFAKELSERLKGTNVSVIVTDPGNTQTKLFSQIWYERFFPVGWSRRLFEFFTNNSRLPNESIEPVTCALMNNDVKNGTFLGPEREEQPWGHNAENESLRQQLWAVSEQWTNISSLLNEFRTDGGEQLPDPKVLVQTMKSRSWKSLWL